MIEIVMVSPNLTIKNTFLWKMIEREPFHHTHLLPEHFFSHFKETSQEACPEPLTSRKHRHCPQSLCIGGQPLEGHRVQPPPQTLSFPSLLWVMSHPFAPHGMRHLNCNTQQLPFDLFSEFVFERGFSVPGSLEKIIINGAVEPCGTLLKK